MEDKNQYTCKILDNLIKRQKLPTLFIGSGISQRYISTYPTWDNLLEQISTKLLISKDRYYNFYNSLTAEFHNSKYEINPQLANILEKELTEKINNSSLEYKNIFTNEQINKMYKHKLNAFKLLISSFFNNAIPDKNLEELEFLKKIKDSISTIITTNYDEFLENYILQDTFDVYDTQRCYYSNEITGIGEVYKIHGSIKNPNTIIINSKDYENFSNNLKLVSARLITLLCNSPFIFLGYSLNDSNINNILCDFISCLDESDLKLLNQNLIFIDYKENETKLIEGTHTINHNGKNISFAKISTDNFQEIYQYILKFTPHFKPSLIRKFNKCIRDIISSNNSGKKRIIEATPDTFSDLTNTNNYAVYFGEKEIITNTITTHGINPVSVETLVLDSLYNGKYEKTIINPADVLHPDTAKKSGCIPYFYYIKKLNTELSNVPQKIIDKIDELSNSIISNSLLKCIKNVPNYTTSEDMLNYINKCVNNSRRPNVILKNLQIFKDGDTLKDFLKTVHESYPEIIKESVFKKLVFICDSNDFSSYQQRISDKRKDAEAYPLNV